ncbi:hypothetical protein ACOSQ3_015025 [Xanthoceras sorbifolium]
MVWVCLGLRRHCKIYFHINLIIFFLWFGNQNPRGGTKRRNFEVDSTSTAATRRKLNVRQPSSHTQAVPESSSQPVTENTPLFDNQQGTHQLCLVNVLNQVFFCYYV